MTQVHGMRERNTRTFSRGERKNMKKIISLLLSLMLLLGCCSIASADGVAASDLMIGAILIGDTSDMGFNYSHQQGLLAMAKECGISEDQIIILENVADDNSCADAINELIANGCNVVIGNSFGFQTYMMEAATANPEVYFCHYSGLLNNDTNFCRFNARNYQTRYLQGIAAAMRSQTGKLGYVAAFKNAENNVSINAFALGAQSINPDIELYVKYTNSWYDPAGETAAAHALIDMGCDVLGQYVNTTGPQVAAQERGVWGLGSDADMTEFAPDAHLFAVCMNWGAIYTTVMNTIINGSFSGGLIYGDVADGTLYMTPYSKNIVEGTEEAIKVIWDKLAASEWDVFQQDVYDNQGNLIPASTFTDDYLYSGMTDLLVKGVFEK